MTGIHQALACSATSPPVGTALQAAGSNSALSTYTFSAQNLGTASANRTIVVFCTSQAASIAPALSSATINGVSATILSTLWGSSSLLGAHVFYAAVPTGTTGDIVMNFASSSLRCAYLAFAVTNVNSIATNTNSLASSDTISALLTPSSIDNFCICFGATSANAGGSSVWGSSVTGVLQQSITTTLDISAASVSNFSGTLTGPGDTVVWGAFGQVRYMVMAIT